jgi:hypothetical protein
MELYLMLQRGLNPPQGPAYERANDGQENRAESD